jgi:hypothetical protein
VSKKEYTAKEAAVALLDKIKAKAQVRMAKSEPVKGESLQKASPENQNMAQVADIKAPQAEAPKANEKMIPKQKELKLKKFMEHMTAKRSKKHGS